MFDRLLSQFGVGQKTIKVALPDDNPLAKKIAAKEIKLKSYPYRHAIIEDFFTQEVYDRLCQEMNDQLAEGLSRNGDHKEQFSHFNTFDAYSHSPYPDLNKAIGTFCTPEWLQFFSNLFDIKITNDISVSYHHHAIGSTSGKRHHDYIISSFKDDPLPNGVNVWFHQCNYTDSLGTDQPGTHQVTRAITIIYYLNNECGGKFGGETAIFDGEKMVDAAAPVNNSLFVFEVSPKSWHNFLTNTKYPRNSIIQWFHQDTDLITERFNGIAPDHW